MSAKEIKNKVVSHVREHKELYIGIGAGVLVTTAGGVVLLLSNGQIVMTDNFNFKWKSPTINEIYTILARRGHPGFIVRCNETGEVASSINRMAEMMGISQSNLRHHLNGEYAHAGGYTFTKLGEAQAA